MTTENPARRPRVVLLHPHCFSERDMQWYVPLLNEFDVVAVTPKWQPGKRTFAGIPQIPLVSLDQVVGAARPVQTLLDRALRLRSENLYYFPGLDRALVGADIVECLETFHPYCRQAIDGKARHGYKLVFSVHENIAFAHENLQYRRQIKADAFRVGDAFNAICEQGRNSLLLEGAPAAKTHVAGAAVDTDRYAPGPPDAALLARFGVLAERSERDFYTLFAGRFVWEKGVLDLVEAMGLLALAGGDKTTGRRYHLLLAGDGPEEIRMRALATRLNIGDRVHFLGRVPRDAMIALYRRADLCAVPSIPTPRWQEQFGCVLIEAMACGCPLLATDSGAIREVVAGCGRLVAPNHHTQLADAIRDLAQNPAERQRLAALGRAHVVRRYDNRVVADRIRHVYRQILGRDNNGGGAARRNKATPARAADLGLVAAAPAQTG